jgi:hypothetical protein
MTIRKFWYEGGISETNNGLTGPDRESIFASSCLLTIPAAAHILKVVASCGISAYDRVESATVRVGYPMTWDCTIGFNEGPSTRFPFGRGVTLNRQCGEFAAATSMFPRYVPLSVGTSTYVGIDPPEYLTTWSAHIDHVDQSMSYGSVHEDIGTRDFGLTFNTIGYATFAGVPAQNSPEARICGVLRVLFEADDGR